MKLEEQSSSPTGIGSGPALANLHPLPGTPEAIALGCKCSIGPKAADGKQLYAFVKGCPIRNHN
jgi:hypothetical protein